MIFGTTIRLPGEFIVSSGAAADLDPTNYVQRLRRHMRDMQPAIPRPHQQQPQIHPDLASCTHVFVRCDAVKPPLQPPYDGPFRIIKRTNSLFWTSTANGIPLPLTD